MSDDSPTVVWVRPAASPRRTAQVLRWLRWLLPAALLVVAPAAESFAGDVGGAITVDADEAGSGPLSLADALGRRLRGRPAARAGAPS